MEAAEVLPTVKRVTDKQVCCLNAVLFETIKDFVGSVPGAIENDGALFLFQPVPDILMFLQIEIQKKLLLKLRKGSCQKTAARIIGIDYSSSSSS